MSARKILDAFDRWSAARADLVLVTVIETEGSTYTKPGHRILIAANGDYQGLVSGGCLEGDLAEHARRVLADGVARVITYDMRDDADAIWGLGVGCNGLIRLLLQRIDPGSDYQPMRGIASLQRAGRKATAAIVIDAPDVSMPLGATAVITGTSISSWQMETSFAERLLTQSTAQEGPSIRQVQVDQGTVRALLTPVPPLRRLLVLGGGPDAGPLVRIADEVGWRVTVADHREAYLGSADLSAAEIRSLGPADALDSRLALSDYDAAVIMSHNLEADRHYLRQVAAASVPYVGLLGPRGRRQRLVTEIGDLDPHFADRLRGPVGLDIGADSPESIAVAIVAEIHACFATFSNRPMGTEHSSTMNFLSRRTS